MKDSNQTKSKHSDLVSLKAHKIFAETIDGVKSVNLMKKMGMKLEGVQRSQIKDDLGY